ncbi:BQ2448_6454 [Microbotryum intermedium]|uniref:BQ2448_6454 protein n=1 Tax=Microbotryum intermedium TaxID=269621 RepID=A0A238FJQ7_9BASI|nr:BQ2448_6454 [Microbotryum intermedium]
MAGNVSSNGMGTDAPTAHEATSYASEFQIGRFGRGDVAKYLARIGLDPSLYLDRKPSYELLSELQAAHLYSILFESTAVHIKDWTNDDAEIRLSGGETAALGEAAFNRLIGLHRGGYCFFLNSLFASLLRYFGFRVSEVAARVNYQVGQDPEVVGLRFKPTSHQYCVIDWEASKGERYLCDVGFWNSQSLIPIPFHDGATVQSPTPDGTFKLVQTTCLPGTESIQDLTPDPSPRWTVWNKVEATASTKDYWAPTYSFALATMGSADLEVLNYYSSHHADAAFVNFFVCSRLLQETGRRTTLYFREGMEHEGSRCARLHTTPTNDGDLEGRWIRMRVGPIKQVLRDEFGFQFPDGYAGN